MSRLESSQELAFKSWLKENYPEWIYRKFTPSGDNGWPDRDLIGPQGHVLYREWKREGKEPEPLQLHRIKQLRKRGHSAEIWDSLEDAKRDFRAYLHSKGLPDRLN